LLLEILQTAPGVRLSVELSILFLTWNSYVQIHLGGMRQLVAYAQHCCTTWQQLEDLEDGAEDARRPAIVGFNGVVADGCAAEPSTLLSSAVVAPWCRTLMESLAHV
jgi:hypothetical protein